MDERSEALRYAQKATILGQILANYRKEKQALSAKDFLLFRDVLDERKHLIELLRGDEPLQMLPESPLLRLQKRHMDDLILQIQEERNGGGFFPQ